MTVVKSYATQSATSKLEPFNINRREPGDNDVQIDILYSGVCHSDIHQARNEWNESVYPMVPGHEIYGKVIKVGKNVKKFKAGDLAAVGVMVDSCRKCRECQQYLEQYCDEGMTGTYNAPERNGSGMTMGGYSTQLALRPFFPDELHNMTDLAFIVFYGCFFFFGVVFYSDQDLWAAIEKNRNKLLIAAVLILIPFYGVFLHWHKVIDIGIHNEQTLDVVFEISSTFLSWFTLITVIGYGQHYLNKPNPILPYTNEGLYPFYILHQTVIIWFGFYICRLDWSIAAKFWSISVLTLIFCVAFYLFIIRPFNVMRLFFGVKKK